jgi:hypothetical protein
MLRNAQDSTISMQDRLLSDLGFVEHSMGGTQCAVEEARQTIGLVLGILEALGGLPGPCECQNRIQLRKCCLSEVSDLNVAES